MKPENTPFGSHTPTTIAPSVNGWNADYLDSMHLAWKEDANSLSKEWQDFFKGFELGSCQGTQPTKNDSIRQGQSRVDSLIYHYRSTGHYAADLDPLGIAPRDDSHLALSSFGFDATQLDIRLDPGHIDLPNPSTLRTIVDKLQATYCRYIGVEYSHIENTE
ncbi:MAG: hypothetical protein H8E86_06760, partial [Planctomycetes bacterium]|nr:hypothetical protein [Planctomycetota bacterium]